MEREMQPIDGILEDVVTPPATVPNATSRQQTRLTGARRVLFALASVALGSGLSLFSAAPAAASVGHGHGYGTEIVFCNAATDNIEVDTTVHTSFTGSISYPGQLTAVRIWYYSYARAKWFTRGWRTGYAFPVFYANESLSLIGGRWLVYVDFGWWNGSSWATGSEYAPVYWQNGYRSSTCYL